MHLGRGPVSLLCSQRHSGASFLGPNVQVNAVRALARAGEAGGGLQGLVLGGRERRGSASVNRAWPCSSM
jgi:hypothetical protein